MTNKRYCLFSKEDGYLADFTAVWSSIPFYTSTSWWYAKWWKSHLDLFIDIEDRIYGWFLDKRYDTIIKFIESIKNFTILEENQETGETNIINLDLIKGILLICVGSIAHDLYKSHDKARLCCSMYENEAPYSKFIGEINMGIMPKSTTLEEIQQLNLFLLDTFGEQSIKQSSQHKTLFVTNDNEDINLVKLYLKDNYLQVDKTEDLENACMTHLGFNPKDLIND